MKIPHLFQSVLIALCLLVSISSFSKEKLITYNIKSNDSRETSLSISRGMRLSVVGPTIGTQPLSQSVCVGSTISLSVVATGNGTLSYIWKKNGNLLFDNAGFVVGSRSANVSVINVQGVDTGTYTCEVTDLDGTTVSSNAVIVVNSLPNVAITDPSAVCAPATVDLSASSVTSGSSSNLTYTYWTDSTASSPLSNFNAITSTGSFYIKGTNTNGCFTIEPVAVTINPLPNVVITNPTAVCSPATVSITSIGVTTGSDANLTYTYFTNSTATATLANPSAIATSGTYYIKGTNTTTGCFVIKPVYVVINALPNIVIINPVTVCAPATIDLSAASVTVGSSSGLTYTYWHDLAASSTLPNYTSIATSGSYYIKGTNSNNCSSTARVDVTINPEPILVINNPASVCPNTTVNLGASSVTSGSSSGLTYTYFTDAAATTPLINYATISTAGTYYIKATNSSNCFVIKPVTVSFNPAPNVVITNPTAVCSPATVSITSIGVTTGSDVSLVYTYFTDPAATATLANPSAIATSGTYYIKGTNTTTGCFVIKPVVVTINSLPSVLITNPAAVCAPATVDLSASSVTVSSSSGLTYTYWRDASATTSLSNYTAVSATGTYYIKGANANGCSSIQPVSVTVNLEPVLTVVNPSSVCASSTIDLTAPAVSSNSTYSLSYYRDASASVQLVSPEAVSTAGTYYIKATNATTGCFTIKPVVVSFNPAPNVVVTNPAAVCSPATVSITSIGVTTGSDASLAYTYFTNSTATTVLANPSAITTSGTYYIKGTNTTTGCFVIKPVVVTINSLPSVLITNPAAVCAPATVDLSASSVTVSSSSGLTYTYWRDASATTSLSNYTAVSASGTYYIKGTNANGCSTTQPVPVTVNLEPVLTVVNPTAVCASNTIDLTAPAVSSNSTYSLSYYRDASASVQLVSPDAVSVAGTYYIKATNTTTGCFTIKPVTVSFNPAPNVVITNPTAVCSPATVSITSIGVTTGSDANLTYTYFTNSTATATLANPSAIATSGTYYIKGTNTTTGCFVIKPVVVTINSLPSVLITNPAAVCAPATVDLSASSVTVSSSTGLTYTYWRDASATTSLSNYTAVSASGTYYIKGTNANGCSSIQPVSVTVNLEPVLTVVNPSSVCASSTIDLTAPAVSSNSTYSLSYYRDASASVQLVSPEAVSVAGTYYIKATNTTTGCFTIKPVTVSFNPAPNVVITNPTAVCSPATVSITSIGVTTGSDANLTYTYFTNSTATATLANPSAIATSGTYYIKGTNTTTGCFVIKPVVVTINSLPSVLITNPAAVCAPATVDLSASSVTVSSSTGLTYTYWRDASATTSLSNYTAVSASGTYYIKGTNANGCSSIQPVSVTVNLEPVLTVVNPSSVCASSTIDLTAPAVSSNSTYSLSYYRDASASVQLVSPEAVSVAGTYYIKATNTTTGCFTIKPVTVSFNPAPNVVITNPTAVCSPATVSITSIGVTTGSDANLTYTYFTNSTATATLANPSAIATSGTYYIKGTNTTTGCYVIKPVVVTINALPSVNITAPVAVCAPATIDLSTALVTVSSSSGLTYTYWRDASATTSLSNYTAVSASGTYYIKGTNANGCSTTQPVSVTVKTLPVLNITTPAGVCSPSTIDLTAASVTAGSSSSLTLGYYTDSAAALELANPSFVNVAGIYYIKATNTNGCSVVKPVQARIDLPPIIAVNSPIKLCANTPSYTLRNSDIQVVDYSSFSWAYDGFGVLTNSNTLTPTYTPNAADISRGKVTLTLTATFCNLSSTRSIDIQFVPMPTVDIGPAVSICENSVSYVIPDTGGTTGYSTLAWTSTGSTGTFSDTTILTPTYTPSAADIAAGSVVLTLRVNSGSPCNTILTATKTVTIQKLPVITTLSSAEICETENVYDVSGTTITNSYDVNSVQWTTSGTGRFISSTRGVNNPSYIPSSADKANGFVTLTISATPTGQCTEIQSKSFRLNFIKSPVINAGPDLIQCGERFQITGATAVAGTYSSLRWTRSGTGTFEDDTVPNPFYIPSTSDIQNGLPITLTLTATPISPCVATTASVSSLRLNLVKSPVITVVNQASICEYDTNVTVLGTIIENQSSYVWTSSTGTVISDIHARQPQVTPSLVDINQGFMDLTITAQNDVCSLPVSRIVRINIIRRPILRAGTTRTVCINDGSITPIVSTFDSSVIDAHVTGLPNGLTGVYNVTNNTFTISGTPTAIGTFPYMISSISSCGELESGVITVAAKTISYKTINYVQATCQNSPIDPIIFNVYTGISNVTISPALPSGIVYTMNATTGILTISGTPTVAVPSLQTYTITPTGTFCGPVGDNTFSISVSPEATITFLSDSGYLNQSVCQNAPIVPITFRIGGSATGVNASLLPPGITLSYATSTGVYTIKGNPTQSGVVTIPIATTGCIKTINATVTKIDTVVSINLISAAGTDSQSICQINYNSPILPIQYLLTGATGATVTGLPNGVTSTFDVTTGIVSIVGAPIVSGIFNYRIETSPCPIIKNGVLKVSTPISITNVRITNVTCSDSKDGKVELTIVGGDSSSYAIHWTGPSGFQQNQASITGLYSGDYTITGTDAIGCPIPSNTYTVLPVLPVKITLQSSTNVNCTGSLGCANFSVTGGSGTYNSFVLQFLDPISQTLRTVVPLNNNYFNICNLQAGLYYLTASDTNNCTTSPYSFTIYDYGNLKIDAINLDDSLCANTPGKVRVTVSSLDPNLTFYYNNVIVPHTNVGNNVYELSISNPTTPTGIIKVLNQQNCWDTATISTTLTSPTQLNYTSVNLATYGVISVNESVKFTNGLTASNIPAEYDYIVWDFGDNSPYSVFHNPRDINLNSAGESITTAFHTYAIDGLYPVTLTVYNHFGCSRSISKIVTVGQGAKIMLPTAFSPNNDGINDLFRPSLLGLKEVSMYIYDNWGNLIYEVSSDTASLPVDWGWNGIEKVNSEPVNGTYRYYIMAKTINDTIIEKEGQFILIK